MSSRKDWRAAKAQMSLPLMDCARCGLTFRQRLPEMLLCVGCEAVWIRAGRPEDELPPMSTDHWERVKDVNTRPRRRAFTPPGGYQPVEDRHLDKRVDIGLNGA